MSVKIKYIRSIDYLVTEPEGDIDFERSKEILVEIAKAKRPPADYDIILDFRRSQLKLSMTDIWYLAKELQDHDNVFKDKVAILVLPGLNFEKAEFFELCSGNRGFQIDVFTNYEDAFHWFHKE